MKMRGPRKYSKPIESMLRSKLSYLLAEPASWKAPLHEIAQLFRQSGCDAVLFGGLLRDLILYGPAERPRDIDIVVDCSQRDLASILSPLSLQRTRFGGFRFQLRKWSFDVWSLFDTWAFEAGYLSASFQNLPKTTFFNIEAIAAQLNAVQGKKRALYSAGFVEAMSSRILDINFEPNPFPQLCIVRGLLTAARHDFLISRRLAHFMTDQGSGREIAEMMQAQSRHYGVSRLRYEDIIRWLDHIERCLEEDSDRPVRLPVTPGEQLELSTTVSWSDEIHIWAD